MVDIIKGISKVTGSICNFLIPDEEQAKRIGERYLSLYTDKNRHNLY